MKNKSICIIISIAAISGLFIGGYYWITNGGWPASGPYGETLPPNVNYVTPNDGDLVTNSHGFCVGFDYEAGNRMTEDQQSGQEFFINGKNISSHMYELVELEYPTGIAELCYRENSPLSQGWHTVVIRFSDSKDNRINYRWAFQNIIQD